jgi:uncharacterized protein (TIGR03032 family)
MTPPTEAPAFELSTSRQFTGWLAENGASLALSTYQSGKVILIGWNKAEGKLSVFERTLDRPMGMAYANRQLAIATMTQIITFVDATGGERQTPDGYDAVFVPQFAHFTADIDVHDIAFDKAGGMLFANTLFCCLAGVSKTHSFKPLWQPPFISRLAPEDRCHLNGLAMRDGEPAFITAVSETDHADGWREHRSGGGVVIEIATGKVLARGLSMPHSPRFYQNRLYVLNSGAGEFGYVEGGQFHSLAFCPGYLRGLAFIGDHALIGLSEPRENKTFAGLPLQDRLAEKQAEPRCGVYVVNIRTGDIAHWLRIQGVVRELYDVIALPGITRPKMIGFRNEEIRRMVTIEA